MGFHLGSGTCGKILELHHRYVSSSLQGSLANNDVGWVTIIGWQAGQASVAFLAASIIQGLTVLNYPNYNATHWQGTLIFYAVIAVVVFINTYLARWLPKIEGMILILHIVGFFVILIPLVYLAPHGSASDVFATFLNTGGWQTNGLSFFVGLVTSVFSFLGTCQKSCHVSAY